MKKFTKILKESISAEEVEDYFLNIEYIFGKPKIKSYGDDIFEFEWNINLRIDEYNTVDSVDKILDAMSSLREIKTSQSRLLDYNVEFKMTNTLNVKITKKNIDKKNFKFIIGQDWREINIDYSELLRFFSSYNIQVTNIEEDYNESAEEASLKIYTKSRDNSDTEEQLEEFCRILRKEIEDGDYDIEVYRSRDNIHISPLSEKTYVVLKR